MKLPLALAEKLLNMIETGSGIPASLMTGAVADKMVEDAVLYKRQVGRNRALLFVKDVDALKRYLFNQFNLSDLAAYVQVAGSDEISRSEAVSLAGDSKLRAVRSFTGFMVNCYAPIPAILNGQSITIQPLAGTFTYIYDYMAFQPGSGVTIIGVENAENFRRIEQQEYLFKDLLPLFVCRYPYSKDLIKWLQQVSCPYLHFGDLDFAGINIFMQEYRRHLGQKASFFIPPNTEEQLEQFGSRELYNKQLDLSRHWENEPEISSLVRLFHHHRKVLEQEIFIKM